MDLSTSCVRDWACKRRWKIKHLDLYRPAIKGKALYVGTAVHAGLESFAFGKDIETTLLDLDLLCSKELFWQTDAAVVERARVRAMLRGYFDRWGTTQHGWIIDAVEKEFEMELAPGIIYRGKIDLIAYNDDSLYWWDHKTSSEEVHLAGTNFWMRLDLDAQITAYTEAVRHMYGRKPRVIWDVLRKPGDRGPKMKKRIAKRKAETVEEFEARKAVELESIDEFEERLYRQISESHDTYFVRRELYRTAEQQASLVSDLTETCREILTYDGSYPRNESMCMGRYGSCPYLGVCTGIESLDSARFEKLDTAHPELSAKEDQNDCPI